MATRKALLTSFLDEVWSQGRLDACDAFIADTYMIRHDPGDPWDGQTLDRAAFKERVRASRAPCPDQHFEIVSLLEDGDRIAIAWSWAATHKGEIAGFAPTGARLAMSGLTIYDFDADGRISGHWQLADRLGIFRQLSQNAART